MFGKKKFKFLKLKKNRKKVLSIIIMVVALLGIAAAVIAQQTENFRIESDAAGKCKGIRCLTRRRSRICSRKRTERPCKWRRVGKTVTRKRVKYICKDTGNTYKNNPICRAEKVSRP